MDSASAPDFAPGFAPEFARESPGVTTPSEITILSASSTDISSSIISRRGRNTRYPEVGFGVVGTNIVTTSSSILVFNSEEPVPVKKTDAPNSFTWVFYEQHLSKRFATGAKDRH